MALPDVYHGQFGAPEEARPYMPFVVALAAHDITLADALGRAHRPENPSGIEVANGRIPNSPGSGIVPAGEGVAAFDLVGAEITPNGIRVFPSSVDSVKRGRMIGEGAIVIETDQKLRLAAFVVDTFRHPWLYDRLRGDRTIFGEERIKVVPVSSLDMPDFEITGVDAHTGEVTARIPRPYF